MNSYFAPAERADEKELVEKIKFISNNSIMTGLLNLTSGMLAVLDGNRQIIALNYLLMKKLGINDPAKALGLRPGEALQCIHAHEEPGGCGTSKFCSSCGAAIAIVTSLKKDKPVEKICSLSARKDNTDIDIALRVKAHPVFLDKKRFLLLFLQDITREQQRAALERTFFHDINNMLTMLAGASELLVETTPSELAKHIHQASLRLIKEIAIQRCLSQNEACHYRLDRHAITLKEIFAELKSFFSNHPAADKKKIEFQENYSDISVNTDISLLLRVLCNIIINALEATDENGVVKIWFEHENNLISFYVWNAREIPQKIAIRIFQRNFSTKEQAGRGIGTFSMKLFGEQILGGKVSFKTSGEGTVFKFSLPL